MMRLLLIAFILLPLAVFAQRFQGLSQPMDYQGFNEDTLTILSWNVEHFVDRYNNPYINNEKEDKPDTNLVNKKIDLLAQAILLSGADVVVLQEFEGRTLAMDIMKNKLKGSGFRFIAGNESPDWYMNVVVLSKVPVGMVYGYGAMYSPIEGMKDSLGRVESQNNINTRICTAEIKVSADFSFMLTGVHLKAGNKERDAATRLGQIELIRGQNNRFLKEDKTTRLVVLGDFNALPDGVEMLRLQSGKKNEALIDPLKGKDIYSHPSDNPTRRIDHILINASMASSLVTDSVKPYMVFSKDIMKEFSDHLPMIAKFIVKK